MRERRDAGEARCGAGQPDRVAQQKATKVRRLEL
jgi:hypothetical protein